MDDHNNHIRLNSRNFKNFARSCLINKVYMRVLVICICYLPLFNLVKHHIVYADMKLIGQTIWCCFTENGIHFRDTAAAYIFFLETIKQCVFLLLKLSVTHGKKFKHDRACVSGALYEKGLNLIYIIATHIEKPELPNIVPIDKNSIN